jgi:hypothetical protein
MRDTQENYTAFDDDSHCYEIDYGSSEYTAFTNPEDLKVTFIGTLEESDYGVPGSPVISSIENVYVQHLTILGVDVDPDKLPKKLLSKLTDLSLDLEWEAL